MSRKAHLKQPINKPKPYYPRGYVGDSSDFIRPLVALVVIILVIVGLVWLQMP